MRTIENFLKAIGHEKRLRILKMLETKDMCVCEITAVLGIKQPTVSRHLNKLKKAGLITERHNGFFSEYRIVSNHPYIFLWNMISKEIDNRPEIKKTVAQAIRIDRYKIKR